ncbi:MAG: hypothetical protein HRU06_08490 [Oceanospirillaceae bacterium]|nr:hypothetical protein [Oceanospirillaceae bacterium]
MNKLLFTLACLIFSTFCAASDFPAPPKAVVINVSAQAQVMGMTMSIRKFESVNSPRSVIDFYQSLWEGEFVVTDMPPWRMIGHSSHGKFYNVQVQNGNGRGAVGYLSVSDAPQRLDAGTLLAPSFGKFPSMGGSELLDRQRHQDLLTNSDTYLLKNGFSVHGNSQFYINHYQNHGWSIRRDTNNASPNVRVILLSKGNEQLNLSIRKVGRGSEIVANMTQGKVLND